MVKLIVENLKNKKVFFCRHELPGFLKKGHMRATSKRNRIEIGF